MEQMKMHSPDLTQKNVDKIRELFPNCVTEAQSSDGKIKLAIDFDQLKQELSGSIVEGPQERYHLNWPGKREALLTATAPIAKTLRPCREESVDFDTTQNLFIEGDNLDALKLLQETYLGKVKMIYIDPPYNTGNDFIYNDDFSNNSEEFFIKSNEKDKEGNRLIINKNERGRFHSDWLSMMYPRIKLARSFLKDDGLIFISVDEGESSNLRKICNEILGELNFITEIVWKNKTGGGAKSKGFIGLHEYILVYCKNISCIEDLNIPYSEKTASMYNKKDEKYAVRGPYATWPLDTTSMGDRPNLRFPIFHEGHEIWPKKQWLWSRDRVEKAQLENMLIFNKKSNGEFSVRFKGYLKDENGIIRRGSPLSIFDGPYSQEGSKDFQRYLPKSVFPFPKPVGLIQQIVNIETDASYDNENIIMDFFAGSGSTAHAVMKSNLNSGSNKKFILIQMPEPTDPSSTAYKEGFINISDITKERIKRVGEELIRDTTASAWNKDIGFRVLKVDTSNMSDIYYSPDQISQDMFANQVSNIKDDRDNEDLLFQVLLDWGVDLTLPIRKETICNKTVFFVDDNALVACFDPNITEDLIKELAGLDPLRVVFRDDGFATDAVKINAEQIFKQLSPGTEVKSI